MLDNVALDVAIGLMFVYLLYSLLATVLSEIIATMIGLRARNLKEAINRMLSDEDEVGGVKRFIDSLNILKSPNTAITKKFYSHPEIKYLGSSGFFSLPSSFKAVSFSKTLLSVLFGNSQLTPKLIKEVLEDQVKDEPKERIIEKETAEYILSLWRDSYDDIVKFKFQLETWFDRTMDQALEWYKRKIRTVLIILGFLLAWAFNADTFQIIDVLSTDRDAREKMVNMASAYLKENKVQVDTSKISSTKELKNYSQKMDSLLQIKKDLEADITKAHTVLGIGCWPPDTFKVYRDAKTGKKIFVPAIDEMAVPDEVWSHPVPSSAKQPKDTAKVSDSSSAKQPKDTTSQKKVAKAAKVSDSSSVKQPKDTTSQKPAVKAAKVIPYKAYTLGMCAKISYLFNLFIIHFFGFLITALAISLGAPFWFDILNKVMKLRTSVKVPTTSPDKTSSAETVLITDREA